MTRKKSHWLFLIINWLLIGSTKLSLYFIPRPQNDNEQALKVIKILYELLLVNAVYVVFYSEPGNDLLMPSPKTIVAMTKHGVIVLLFLYKIALLLD